MILTKIIIERLDVGSSLGGYPTILGKRVTPRK